MIAYAYVVKGLHHDEGVCQDTVLLGNMLVKDGFAKADLGEYFLTGISDGIGGTNAGELASGMTMLSLASLKADEIAKIDVTEALDEANGNIYEIGRNIPSMQDMGATLTLLGKVLDGTFILQLGNTRMYELVNLGMGATVMQLTRDHNRINDYIVKGMDTKELEGTREAEALTTYMGMRQDIFASAKDISAYLGSSETTQRIFITSDGIHDHISYEELSEAFLMDGNPEMILRNIIDMALKRGSRDDLSIIMLVDKEEDLMS